MAQYQSFLEAGETDSNVFDATLLANLLRFAPDGPQLSSDRKSIYYDLGFFGSLEFQSDAGFSGRWAGTINAITVTSNFDVTTTAQGLAIDATAFGSALYSGESDTMNALVWNGDDQIFGSASNDLLRGFAGNDVLRGGTGNDTLIGDAGGDRLRGAGGDDNLFGGKGNDLLGGGSGDDVLVGGNGRDVLDGGTGSDRLTGGWGADVFRIADLSQFGDFEMDTITDFRQLQGDKIDLHLIDADTGTDGDQAFTFYDNTGDTITELPTAGSLLIEPDFESPTGYVALMFVDNSGSFFSFRIDSANGVPTADDFIL